MRRYENPLKELPRNWNQCRILGSHTDGYEEFYLLFYFQDAGISRVFVIDIFIKTDFRIFSASVYKDVSATQTFFI
jgi:hypothetical protein